MLILFPPDAVDIVHTELVSPFPRSPFQTSGQPVCQEAIRV